MWVTPYNLCNGKLSKTSKVFVAFLAQKGIKQFITNDSNYISQYQSYLLVMRIRHTDDLFDERQFVILHRKLIFFGWKLRTVEPHY
jgi:hypothetical protein